MPTVSGAVLCGGASRRMGTDKAFVEVDGRSMVLRVIDALASAGVSEVVAVGGDADRLERLGVSVVADDHPGEGPLGGLITALRQREAGPRTEIMVVVACDLALLDGEVVGRLIERATGDDVDVAMAVADGDEPLCAAWRVDTCLPVVARSFTDGVRSMKAVLPDLRVGRVPVEPRSVHNVNAPADLHGL